jgi:hypothetical protein
MREKVGPDDMGTDAYRGKKKEPRNLTPIKKYDLYKANLQMPRYKTHYLMHYE